MCARNQLVELLESRFFSYVENLGFVRDQVQRKGQIIYRKMSGDVVWAFIVTGNIYGNKGFTFEFAEIPCSGLTWMGEYLSSEAISPQNIGLMRGRLLARNGSSEFGKHLNVLGVFIHDGDAHSKTVDDLMGGFSEVMEWWESKKISSHIVIFEPVSPPIAPAFRTKEIDAIAPKQPTPLQKALSRAWVWNLAFFAISISITVLVSFGAYLKWDQLVVLIPVGAAGGALVAWILISFSWWLWAKQNGAPFSVGDVVQVIRGRYAGRVACVYDVWPTRNQIRLALGKAEWQSAEDVFSHIEVFRLKEAGE